MTTSAVSRRNFLCLSAGAAALAIALPLVGFDAALRQGPPAKTKLTWDDLVRARDIARANCRLTGRSFVRIDGDSVTAVDPFRVFS